MMACVVLKLLKFTKIINGRLSFVSGKSYHYNSQLIIRTYNNARHGNALYTTAAYQRVAEEDAVVKNSAVKSDSNKGIRSVDNILLQIDSLVRQNGRTQMKNVYRAFSMISDKEMTSSTHGLHLIRSCKYCYDQPSSKRIELVNQIWNRYYELGIQFDVRHYNALLDVHISNGLDFNPAEILASMENIDIQPNKVTFMLLMKKYCEDGNINGASEILEHMKEKGMPLNEEVFNYLIEGHIKNNDFSGAKDMIEAMRSSNLEPTADIYSTLACGYAASGNKDEMMSYLKECQKSNGVHNYLKVINALANSGNHQHVDSVFSLIEHKEMYKQEFINCAIEMIHRGFVDIAYKLALASYTPNYNEGTNIFIKQLIKTDKPIAEILRYSTEILKGGYNDIIFLVASRTAVQYQKLDYILPIFEKMLEQGHYVRPSSFWSLITSLKEDKSPDDIWKVLSIMNELGVPADFSTYYDIIYPVLGQPQPEYVIHNVENVGQVKAVAAEALFTYYANMGEIDLAKRLIEITHVNINENLNENSFLSKCNYFNSDSLEKYLKVLNYMFKKESYVSNRNEIQGKLLAALILRNQNLLEILLKRNNNLTFDTEALNMCEHILAQRNPSKLVLVKKLRNLKVEGCSIFEDNLTVEEENAELKFLQAQNRSWKSFMVNRIFHHIKKRNIARVTELLSLFDQNNLTYTPLLLSSLTSLYCTVGDVEKATAMVNKLITEVPNFNVDISKALDYITLLVKYQKFSESSEAMKNLITEPYNYTTKESVLNSVRKLNLALRDSNNVQFVKDIQNLLIPLSNGFKTKTLFFDSLVYIHLQRNDLISALEEFRSCIMNHQVAPCLNPFLKKCINSNEKNIFEKVVDLAISCVGKSNALLELALVFIETHNFEKASTIIQSIDREVDSNVLERMCMHLRNQNKFYELEQFLHLTRPVNQENREKLYYCVIKVYAERNEFDKALKLFDKLKEEIGEPSDEIVNLLEELFKKNNQPLPLTFVSKSTTTNELSVKETKNLIEHLKTGDAKAVLKELSELKKGYIRSLSLKTLTDLVELCLEENCVNDLSNNVNAMTYIIDNVKDVLEPLLEKYSAAGDVEKLSSISSFIPDFSLMSLGFNAYFCRAFISSGKFEDLLLRLEQHTDKKNKLFSAGAFVELLKHPQFEDRIFNLAVKYYDSKYGVPMAVIWANHFLKENYEMANKILLNFVIPVDKVDNFILRTIRQNENVTLAQKYVSLIKSLNVRQRVKEKAYGAAIDVLVLKGMYDEAVALVVESEKLNLQLYKYYLSTLITLKNTLEEENKPIPFNLPSDVSSSCSSESEQHI